jgi:hypothetical protein
VIEPAAVPSLRRTKLSLAGDSHRYGPLADMGHVFRNVIRSAAPSPSSYLKGEAAPRPGVRWRKVRLMACCALISIDKPRVFAFLLRVLASAVALSAFCCDSQADASKPSSRTSCAKTNWLSRSIAHSGRARGAPYRSSYISPCTAIASRACSERSQASHAFVRSRT